MSPKLLETVSVTSRLNIQWQHWEHPSETQSFLHKVMSI